MRVGTDAILSSSGFPEYRRNTDIERLIGSGHGIAQANGAERGIGSGGVKGYNRLTRHSFPELPPWRSSSPMKPYTPRS